jgi:hypothetical protein
LQRYSDERRMRPIALAIRRASHQLSWSARQRRSNTA